MTKGWRAGLVALAVLASLSMAGSTGAGAAETTVEWSPYLMLSDPVPANPAAFPWRAVALSVGPLGAEVASSEWTAGQVAEVIGALASGGDVSGALSKLSSGAGAERLRWTGNGRVMLGIAAVQLGYGLATAGSGMLPEDAIRLLSDATSGGPPPASSYDLDGTRFVSAAWWDGFVRVNASVPFIPRLLGIQGFSAGAGVHWLQGASYFTLTGKGTVESGGDGTLTARRSTQGSGMAYEAGAVARLNRFLAVEGAYVGNGAITWRSVERRVVDSSGSSDWEPVNESERYTLPDVALVGIHLRPLASGLLELSSYYSRIGVNQPQSVDRLQAEASVNALGILRATVGGARESTDRQWRLYASVGFGLGASGLTIRAVDLQEVGKGPEAKSLGVSVTASLGF